MSDNAASLLLNAHRVTPKKSILICGSTRGGTSFAASVFLRLGVPFSRPERNEITERKHEHRRLRAAFMARDEATLKAIGDQFAASYETWAWKLPAIQNNFEMVLRTIPNPHFVLIFKDPAAVSFRKVQVSTDLDFVQALDKTLYSYSHMLHFAKTSDRPIFVLSYEKALEDRDAFLSEAASFAGVADYDVRRVWKAIRRDGHHYDRPEPEGAPAGDATAEEADAES